MNVYKRKTSGEKCDKCWNEARQQGKNDCAYCFGTGFKEGYEPMHQIYVREKPAFRHMDLSSQGYVLNSNPGAWTISNIKFNDRDLLINPQGKMFSIISSHINHAAGYLFHQEIQMKEIDPNDVRYNIKKVTLYPEF